MDFSNYECDGQMSIFDYVQNYKITKPIRLIELFAGVGSQAMALRDIGAAFETYRVVEFDKYAIKSYNAIHGTDFPTMDITKIHASDLNIVDTDKYEYIMTYSFPCQDLSLAGKGKGMEKGSGTRSGLLWEVERLLNETENLPQILLMENVAQVHGKKNKDNFDKWIKFLEGKGYSNFWKDLNAKNYGIPQNRNRCFMVSILGKHTYKFPSKVQLKLRLKDILEENVDEKYYIKFAKNKKIKKNYIQYDNSGKGYDSHAQRLYYIDSIMCSVPSTNGGDKTQIVLENKEKCIQIANESNKNNCILETSVLNCKNKQQEGIIEKLKNKPITEDPILIGGTQKFQAVKTDGISTTLTASMGTGGGYVPMITELNLNIEPNVLTPKRTEYGKEIRKDYEAGKIKESRHNMNELVPGKDGISNTLTTVQKDNLVIEPSFINKKYKEFKEKNGYIPNMFNPYNCCEIKDIAPTQSTCCGSCTSSATCLKKEDDLRIRKLTPKECWRLMGFTDQDFEKAEKVNSNTQLYKQAGNSIVKQVLMAIFKQLL